MNLQQYIDLSLLESKLEEDVYMTVEEIIDKNDVLSLNSVSKDKWESLVVDKGMRHSVRLHVKSEKIRSFQCSCPHDLEKSICPHIGAASILLRKKLQDERQNEKAKIGRKRNARSFDLKGLLDNISKEDLDAFIMSKARQDKNFKLLLQARFIKKISSNQLESFVESTFPVLTKANEKIPASKLKAYIDITEELIKHFKNLIAQSNLTEAYELIFLLLASLS